MPDDARSGRARRNALEWAVFALGAALTAGVVGFLVADAVRGGAGDPPDLRVTLGAPVAARGQVLAPVRVANVGGRAAEAVRVEVCRDGTVEACGEVEFAYIPRASQRAGEVGLEAGGGALTARVVSYLEP